METFDPREESAKLVEHYIIANGEPDFDDGFISKIIVILKTLAMKHRKAARGEVVELSAEEENHAELLLYMISIQRKMTPEIKEKYKVWSVLKTIIMPDNKFPEAYQKISQALFDEFDAIDWGAPIEPKGSKNQRPIGSSETGTPRSAKPKVAPIDHPIYGLNGPMHHIQQCQGDWEGAKRYYMLDSSFPPKDWKVFGHNGLTVGQCWPLLVAAYRDGAHGERIAGISGTMADGCYSILVSGGSYSDKDQDLGDRIRYSDSQADSATDPTPDRKNKFAGALVRSSETKRPVRVLRSSSGGWSHSPRAGVRYDGLYVVDKCEVARNKKNGAFFQFYLHRLEGQIPIQTSKPTAAQEWQFKRVSSPY